MIIDKNPDEMAAMEQYRAGNSVEANKIQDRFVDDVMEGIRKGEDHCPCKVKCKWHGKCLECVAIHRGHTDHLPECFRDMVNERIRHLSSLTEHTALDQEE